MMASIFTPFISVKANEKKDLIKFQWKRNSGYNSVNKFRKDSIPIIDNEGNVYIVDEYGYLNCIKPNKELKYRANIFQSTGVEGSVQLGGSSPVVDSKLNAYIASNDNNIYAFNADGSKKWTYTMKSKVSIAMKGILSPKEDVVYMVDYNGRVYAINTNDGSLVWKTESNMGSGFSSPAISSDGKILYIATNSRVIAFNTTKENLFEAKRIMWKTSTDDNKYFYLSSLTGGCQYEKIPSTDSEGNLYIISIEYLTKKYYLHKFLKSGKEQWKINIGLSNIDATTPAYYNGYLYYKNSENQIFKLNPLDEKPNPQRIFTNLNESHCGSLRNKPIIVDGKMYTQLGGNIYVLDLNTEKVLRRSFFNDMRLWHISKPTLRGDIYASDGLRTLFKFNDTTIRQIPNSVKFQDEDFLMRKGAIYTPKLNIKDKNGYEINDNINIMLKSENENVVKVEGKSLKAIKEGKTNIIANVEGMEATAQIEVLKDLSKAKIEILKKDICVELKQKTQIVAQILVGNKKLNGEKIGFKSKHEKIAFANQEGVITGISKGIAKIEAYVERDKTKNIFFPVYVTDTKIRKVDINEIKTALNKSLQYLKNRKGLSHWEVFTTNAIGVDPNSIDGYYVTKIKELLKQNKGQLGSKMTDYEKICISLLSVGQDVTHFVYDDKTGAYIDFIKEIRNGAGMGISQGNNAVIWGLIALNSTKYDENKYTNTPYNKEFFINYILKNKSGDGWSLGGGSADPDMTGMALYALAPYRNRPNVKEAGEKAIKWLKNEQSPDGKFGTLGQINSCSISQVIMGIVSWGIDPQGSMFTKSNGNAVTALMTYYLGDGTFAHISGYDPQFGTPQGIQALAALKDYYESSDEPLKRRSDIWENIRCAKDEQNLQIKSIYIEPNNLILPINNEVELSVLTDMGTIIDNKKIQWKSSNEDVVIVENGKIKTMKNGEVFITANYQMQKDKEPISAQIKIIVTNLQEFEVERNLDCSIDNLGQKTFFFNVTNKTDKPLDAVFMVNLFEKDEKVKTEKLIQQVYVKTNFNAKDTEEMAVAFDVPNDNKQYNVKVMLWDDLSTARSLKNALEIKGVK